jgi:hypothetical protein
MSIIRLSGISLTFILNQIRNYLNTDQHNHGSGEDGNDITEVYNKSDIVGRR